MGGMEVSREPGLSDIEFFRRQLGAGQTSPRGSFEILDAASKNNVCYMVVQWTNPDGSKEPRECMVANFTRLGNNRFFYNAHGETSGPVYRECPERILKQLDPITPCEHPQGEERELRLAVGASVESCGTDYAIQWRAECWDVINARKAAIKVEVGDKFRLHSKLRFGDKSYSWEDDTFTLVQKPRMRNIARCESTRSYVRLPREWRTMVVEVLMPADGKQLTLA